MNDGAATSALDDAEPVDGVIGLAGRRQMTFRTFGASHGRPIIALHGTPGSRLKFSATHKPALALGQRVIAPDRWAYGGTSAHPSPTLAGFASDLMQLADALQLERFSVLGVSGGGPYASAVAALFPDRVTALALVAPAGLISATPRRDLMAFQRFCFGPLARQPAAVAAIFRAYHRLLTASPRFGVTLGNVLAPKADRQVLAVAGVRERLAQSFIEGLSAGGIGPATDLSLFAAPWQLPLEAAQMPARMWLGTEDRNVPLASARRLAAALPDCAVETIADAGHLWVALHYADVLAWIAQVPHRES
ncbi:MAG: alpha/beta fold hydrolase [Hyphomicrobiaceae bacterium]